ncbi:MAG: pyrroloquinoline quinone biosynthesis protein PqqE [Micrococcaceae bacterium]|uniref:PqqA peptide cyclase n=1 Tax=Arthrobacter cheniae TaxID=1258888 RepID=A0A3A5LXS4_9MICC|nr:MULTISPECIES: pyrroloquinoline quinone biosynthesis protein PqqE [Arthrobacter]MCU1634606.1 pyrroloquinoline quinone biosynthesis protein PqqE [Micrococcaceae bacterium]MEC5198517.1 pyrroloquinoline quinone biosynthesis protein E [Arthrobacter sp. PL16]RJT76254.1 pyrroloquinoline quinone biosynthesis protein PqqE [Arthrobacter cheniae]
MDKPYGLLAELTYSCPLQCGYCSNPLQLDDYRDELSTEEWKRVFSEAADLGVLQLHLSGGEPLQRHDIVELVQHANQLGLYTNLITSGLGLSTRRAEQLRAAGLDHVQLSIQADDQALSDQIAVTSSFERKRVAAGLIKKLGWPLTLNVVLHRQNIDRIGGILDMAEAMEADRVELANTQYAGWAGPNQAELLPTRDQLEGAEAVVQAARERIGDRIDIIYVIPDYYSKYPKPCMDGWASRQFTVVPNGEALPCPAAHELARGLNLPPATVREHSLEWIWTESPLFQQYRGDAWMPDPCRSCDRKEIDFGGCRCQAFALTGDAARTDPVCHLSPDHGLVEAAVAAANDPQRPKDGPLIPRAKVGRTKRAVGATPGKTAGTPVQLSRTVLKGT